MTRKNVVCYYEYTAQNRTYPYNFPAEAFPYDLCTHVIWRYASLHRKSISEEGEGYTWTVAPIRGDMRGKYIIPLFHRAFGSSFTRRKQGLFLLVTYGRLLCHSLMNLICVCRLSGQCLTCRA